MNARTFTRVLLPVLLCCVTVAPLALCAQGSDSGDSARVLLIQREFTKPGKGGGPHQKTEAEYIQALKMHNGSQRYIGMTSMSGVDRALFFVGYPSFAAMEAETKGRSPELSAALDKAIVDDGDMLTQSEESVWLRRDDLSTNVKGPRTGSRYMDITQFVVKPGHREEFEEVAKMYVKAAEKVPAFHWTAYSSAYGACPGACYIVITAYKSLSEVDDSFASGKALMDAMGKDGVKKLKELEASSVESEMTNLFSLDPKMSYPPDALKAGDEAFWTPKASKPAVKKQP
jgi:hypothetical protein